MTKQHYKVENYRLAESVGYLLKDALRALQDRLQVRFASHGFTFQQWIVLMHVRDGLASTIADLCRETRHDSGAMTRLVDQLEKRDLVQRKRNHKDRRVVELQLTREGQRVADSLKPLLVDTLNEALDGFTRTEVKELEGYLRRIGQTLREPGAKTTALEKSA